MKNIVRTPGAAKGRCRSVTYGDLVWIVAVGKGGTISEQTTDMLNLVERLLVQAETTTGHILEATIYLSDMADKEVMDAIWCDWIPADGWPCRACVGTDLAPGDLIEIKLVAAI